MPTTGSKGQENSQIKSKKRVSERGEVFTAEREVKAMCDLVAQECDRIDSRFLEPACGNGNFLAEILTRKLATVKKLYKSNPYDYERYSVLAITSIYGVDIMQDNVQECRERLFALWNKGYKAVCKKATNDETCEAVQYVLSKNILCGNALTLMCVDENQKDTDTPIIFPEWSLMLGTKL
ncbi:MAG: restriction endonuclease subunit M, partial [Candidatus Scatosoma sp.]